jgi:hypothetical protein
MILEVALLAVTSLARSGQSSSFLEMYEFKLPEIDGEGRQRQMRLRLSIMQAMTNQPITTSEKGLQSFEYNEPEYNESGETVTLIPNY